MTHAAVKELSPLLEWIDAHLSVAGQRDIVDTMLSQAEDAIRAAEREACAKIAEGYAEWARKSVNPSAFDSCSSAAGEAICQIRVAAAAETIAMAIRARGKA
jgi:hypothetical protein